MQTIDFWAGTDAGNGGASGTEFADENVGTGYLGTEIKSGWLNSVQNELVNAIVNSGLTLDELDETQLEQAIKIYSQLQGIPIGMPIPLWYTGVNSVVSVFSNNFIQLSKDLTGAGLYNEGKITGQATVTTNETKFYTGIVDVAGSPINAETVTLINSTQNTTDTDKAVETFLGAGETAGVRLADQIQGHSHDIPADSYLNQLGSMAGYTNVRSDGTSKTLPVEAVTITSNIHGTPRVGYNTRPVTVSAVWYMRVL